MNSLGLYYKKGKLKSALDSSEMDSAVLLLYARIDKNAIGKLLGIVLK